MNALMVCFLGFLALAVFSWVSGAADQRDQEARRGWRVRCVAAGSWAYDEKRGDAWRCGFVMEEITDFRESPHHLQIMGAARWGEYPEWVQGRRDEILARIRAELKEPGYVLKEA